MDKEKLEYYKYIVGRLVEFGAVRDKRSVADYPCGEGDGLSLFIPHHMNTQGYDQRESSINVCNARNIDAEIADITKIPAEDGSFNIFICFCMLQRLEKYESLIAASEMKRVTNKNGYICVAVPRKYARRRHKQKFSYDVACEQFHPWIPVCISDFKDNRIYIFRRLFTAFLLKSKNKEKQASHNIIMQNIYNELFSHGYHRDPDKSHSITLCKHAISRLDFKSVLDVGCAKGRAVHYMRTHHKDSKGLDISDVAVAEAQKMGRPCFQGSITDIPFPDNSFDLVLTTDTLEHVWVDQAEKAIDELFRVAKKFLAIKVATDYTAWKYSKYKRKHSAFKSSGLNSELEDLHLTIKDIDWWMNEFKKRGGEITFRKDKMFLIRLEK